MHKTDVCRKSLNPTWNSEWLRFEVLYIYCAFKLLIFLERNLICYARFIFCRSNVKIKTSSFGIQVQHSSYIAKQDQ